MAKKPKPLPKRERRTLRVRKGGRYVMQPDGTLLPDTEKEKADGTADE